MACEALGEFWPERNGPPKVEGLDAAMKAEVLLRVGALAGWSGSAHQAAGSQETAKNLITQSIEIFEGLGLSKRAAEARADLALCYWREGAFDEARIYLANALSFAGTEDIDLRAIILNRAGTVEIAAGHLIEALRILNDCTPLLDQSSDDALKGTFHNQLAVLFKNLGRAGRKNDYVDRALIEFAAASFYFEQAGHIRYQACVENNLGSLLLTVGRFAEAHAHLNLAAGLFRELQDDVHVSQVNDTRARTLLAEGRVREAERYARLAVRTLEKGDEQALFAEALTTHGVALARLTDHSSAKRLLQRAIEVAQTAGDVEGAGRAKLSVIEELAGQTPAPQLVSIYRSATELLRQSQDPSTSRRLIVCAEKVIEALGVAEIEESQLNGQEPDLSWASFKREVRKAEKALIERALRQTEGSVTHAAHLLGFKHHQSLISIINIRHKDLSGTRSIIRKRRRRLISQPRKIRRKAANPSAERRKSQISILHLEDNAQVVDCGYVQRRKLAYRTLHGRRHRAAKTDGRRPLRSLNGR